MSAKSSHLSSAAWSIVTSYGQDLPRANGFKQVCLSYKFDPSILVTFHFEGTEGFSKSAVYLDPRPPFGTFPKTNPILKIKAFLSHL